MEREEKVNTQSKRKAALAGVLAALALLLALGGAAALAQGSAKPASILTVCPPPGTGCDYTTIQAAINNAGAGDTIRIAAGTYTENLTVTLPITLEGGYSGPPDWTRSLTLYETIVDGSGSPTTPGDWDGDQISFPRVISASGQYRMWYNGQSLTASGWGWALGLAASPDGLTWTKDGGNPVLEPGSDGEWDSAYRGQVAVLQEGGLYKMWYSGSDGGPWQTGYATSTNGLDWNIYAGNPVLPVGGGGSWDEQEASAPTVIQDGGLYKMWYHGCTPDYSLCSVGYATSTNGLDWTKYAGNPVLTGTVGGWDEGVVMWPSVVKDGGAYKMWYYGGGGQIGLATSPDGLNWTKEATNPILTGGWGGGGAFAHTVMLEGGTYKMWLVSGPSNSRGIGYAESTDGISWTMSVSNPVLTPGTGTQWGSPVVRFESGGDGSVLDGLTLTGGGGKEAGGVDAANIALTIRHCLIRDNRVQGANNGWGGGGVLGGGPLTIVDSRIVNNYANQGAGGVRPNNSVTMTNVLLAGNSGDAALHANVNVSLTNVTVADNANGGILFNPQWASTLAVRNSIIYNNGYSFDFGDTCPALGTCQVAYSDIEGGWPGAGNINANPAFVNPANGDYHLSAWSPAIDVGTASGAPDHDLEGTPRPQNAGYDMGAYEFVGTPLLPAFTDVAPDLGLDVSSGEFGAAWGDLDGDGWLDLTIGDGSLFTSSLGTAFHDATAAAGLDSIDSHGGVAWGDYDHDGDLDLLSNKRKIYRQNSLPFTKVFDDNGGQTSLAWVDYDLDGDLDAYADGRLYRNDGGDIFTDVTGAAGLSEGGWLASAWADYDDDGDPDLYLTCNGCPNRLFANNGDGTFTDVTGAAGVGDGGSGHGAAWGDYDNDGDLDLLIANNNDEYNVLYRNEGDGTFSDVSITAGLRNRLGFGTSVNWLDYDLDGWLDFFVVHREDENGLYRNNGDGTFSEVGPASGVANGDDSDGSTVGDYDNDGDSDIYVVSGIWGTGTPNYLYRNNTDPGAVGPHWLKVKLEGTLSNRSAIGARVRVYGGGLMQTRQLAGSTGYMSQDALEALFGLGTYSDTVTVEVAWPSGVVNTRSGVALDQTIVITESAPHLRDMALVNVSPGGEVPWNQAFSVLASLRNLGSQLESGVPVTCQIEYGGATVYDQAQTSGDIPPLTWAQLTFPDYTPTALGAYTLTCRAGLPGDENPANDVYSRTLTAVHHPPDAWTQDNPNDNGDVPSGYDDWYMSPDIWVRHAPDGGLVHQEPIANQANTVYVRLRNRGEYSVTGTLDVTWIESSLGVRCGDWAPIGTVSFANLLPGETRIVSTTWTPIRSGHTCLQTVIDSTADPYDRGLECAPQWVPYDNNVSWRNVEI